MIYVVIEMQTMQDGQMGFINTQYTDRNQAESAYHSILAAAAVSQLSKHAAVLMTNEGFTLMSECYTHEVEE